MKGLLTPHAYMETIFERGDVDIQFAPAYAEPGYSVDGPGILFANWNAETKYHAATETRGAWFETIDDTMPRIGKIAEHLGYECEWSDEWAMCDGCQKAVRTSANSYGWTASYWMGPDDCTILCHECVTDDPSDYLEFLRGNDRAALTINIDLSDHGYVKQNDRSYENGWHPGQNDSPEVIGKSLRDRGVDDYIFTIDSVGQFDLNFSVWVHEEQTHLLEDATIKSELPYDPGTEMAKVLRGEHSDHYRMTTRTLTPEEFVSGDWKKNE